MQNKTKRNIKKMIIASGAMVFVIISSVTANADTKSPARTDSDFVVVAEADGNVDQAAVDRANELLNRLPVQVLKNFQNRGWRFLVTDKNIARTYYSGQYSSVQGIPSRAKSLHVVANTIFFGISDTFIFCTQLNAFLPILSIVHGNVISFNA